MVLYDISGKEINELYKRNTAKGVIRNSFDASIFKGIYFYSLFKIIS